MKIKNEMKNINNKMKIQQKPPRRFSQAKYHRWEFLTFRFKKMITEVLLVLPLYLILFFIWWRFRHLIKAMTDVVNIFNDDDFLRDTLINQKKALSSIKNEKN